MEIDGKVFYHPILTQINFTDNMIAHSIFFYFFSFIAIISAFMVTVSKNTVHSVSF